jgi:glycosyltransferase 2 family protein
MNRKRALWTVAAIGVTALCLYLILTDEMVRTLRQVLPRVQPLPLILVLPLTLVINQVRSARFALALGTSGPGTALRMGRICALLVFLNYLLPFKMGELSFPVLAKRTFDVSYATSLGVLGYSRVLDLLMVLSLGGFVLGTLPGGEASGPARLALPVAAGAALTLLFVPFLVVRFHDAGQRLTRSPRLLELMERLFQGCRAVASPRRHAVYLALTLAVWVLHATCGLCTMRAMGAQNGVLDGVIASAAASVTFAFPVSGVAGVGPMQASWAYALTLRGWKWEMAVANALLAHATLVASSAVIGLLAVVLVDGGPGPEPAAKDQARPCP